MKKVSKATFTDMKTKASALFLSGSILVMNSMNEALATDVVTGGTALAKSIYSDVLKIATPIAIAAFVFSLLISMFSRDQKKIDTSRGIAKGVVITWVVILAAGGIMTYGQSLMTNAGFSSFNFG